MRKVAALTLALVLVGTLARHGASHPLNDEGCAACSVGAAIHVAPGAAAVSAPTWSAEPLAQGPSRPGAAPIVHPASCRGPPL